VKILFLDQTGQLGGAELSLLDLAGFYHDRCLVALFSDGPFYQALQQRQIPAKVLRCRSLTTSKDSGLIAGLVGLYNLLPLVRQVLRLSRDFDVIYANTPKALMVGAMVSLMSHKPLVYHLRDIISPAHFSWVNCRLLIGLTNAMARLVIANSQATRQAFIQAGGKASIAHTVYNGFAVDRRQITPADRQRQRQELNLEQKFVVGHFSRLSPWKGQDILIAAIAHCPIDVVIMLVGDALFGEDEYVRQLHQQVAQLGLIDRVQFLGFRDDIPALMSACDLVAHTSTAPEPFGRVIVEAMLCETAVVGAAAGGVMELIEHKRTGWLTPPGDVAALTAVISQAQATPIVTARIAQQAHQYAAAHFQLLPIQQQIDALIASTSSPNHELTTTLCI
jgi:glycosyltransferase involved in cell wall biosynthesis